MFLHMKWVRARWIYYTVMVLSLIQSLLVIGYGMLNYGQLGWYVNVTSGYGCEWGNMSVIPDYYYDYPAGSLPCIGWWFRIPVIASAVLIVIVQTAKLIQVAKKGLFSSFFPHCIFFDSRMEGQCSA